MTRDRKWFGEQLRALRKERGLSLAALEERSGFKEVRVGSWERGDRETNVTDGGDLLDFYGKEFAIVPKGFDVDATLARIAELETTVEQVAAAYRRAGGVLPLAAVPDERVAA